MATSAPGAFDWLPLMVAFLGGSVMATAFTGLYRLWNRPILSARLDKGFGCLVTTWRGNPPTHQAHFLRLRVENIGLSMIKNCKGYVTAIRHCANGVKSDVRQEVLELKWSSCDKDFRDIPRGAFFYLDIASLDLYQNGQLGFWLCVNWLPNHYSHLLTPAEFELDVKIVADNASPIDHVVRFAYDQAQAALVPKWDHAYTFSGRA